jgi:hypothetical protein
MNHDRITDRDEWKVLKTVCCSFSPSTKILERDIHLLKRNNEAAPIHLACVVWRRGLSFSCQIIVLKVPAGDPLGHHTNSD